MDVLQGRQTDKQSTLSSRCTAYLVFAKTNGYALIKGVQVCVGMSV